MICLLLQVEAAKASALLHSSGQFLSISHPGICFLTFLFGIRKIFRRLFADMIFVHTQCLCILISTVGKISYNEQISTYCILKIFLLLLVWLERIYFTRTVRFSKMSLDLDAENRVL